MIRLALSLVLAAGLLAACATTPEALEARRARLEAADRAAEAAAARYCGLHPMARAVLRAKITGGVPVIECPEDAPASAAVGVGQASEP